MDLDAVTRLLQEQDGTITRRQVLECGGSPADLERQLRRRHWVRILPGVFIDHTGQPTWRQRAWAGVHYYWPAALADRSALRSALGPGWRVHDDRGPIVVGVDEDRHVVPREGFQVRRIVRLEAKSQWNTGPPRMRLEEAAVDVAAAAPTEFEAIAVLSGVCQSRRTTARRLRVALDGRSRLRWRAWLEDVLLDVEQGTCSVLEHGYLERVERAHGLPRADRQPSAAGDRGPIYRDVDYGRWGLLVELDGRLFHDTARQRDLDLDRDLDAAVDGRSTVRLGWGQVFDRPCRTAGKVARLLQQRGWPGSLQACGAACSLAGDNPVALTRQAR